MGLSVCAQEHANTFATLSHIQAATPGNEMATVNIVEYGLSLRLLEEYTLVDQVRPLAVIADLLCWYRAGIVHFATRHHSASCIRST